MDQNAEIIAEAIKSTLNTISQEREIKIIEQRFGLNGHKSTLEQIGDALSVTRERVRQLEKVILVRLRVAANEGKISGLPAAEKILIRNLSELGRVARLSVLADRIVGRPSTPAERARLSFLAEISKSLTVLSENDKFHAALAISDLGDEKTLRSKVTEIVTLIKSHKSPLSLDELDNLLTYEQPAQIAAVASVSKQLATLNNLWGLSRWPTVNPKNIRDKIFVILSEHHEPMHFSAIAEAITSSNFKRKNVTTQAIHNELIKDPRFVLIGRGIYALDSWGYKRGTVAEIITDALKKSDRPLSREEIVAAVLKSRQVKETTILLNLQNKDLFTRVSKNSYTLRSAASAATSEKTTTKTAAKLAKKAAEEPAVPVMETSLDLEPAPETPALSKTLENLTPDTPTPSSLGLALEE